MHIGVDASRATVAARTGTEGYSFHLIPRLVRAGSEHRFTLYVNRPPGEATFDAPNAAIRAIPARRLWTHGRLSLEMARAAPDVLFVPAHVIPIFHPRRSVVTIHDVGYLFFRSAYRPLRWLYLWASTIYSARVARRVIADSGATRDDLVRHLRVPAGKIEVVHLGRDPAYRPLSRAEIEPVLARRGLEPGYFVFVGTVQPRKNVDGVLRALAEARREVDARLVVVGQSGAYAGRLVGLAGRLGVVEAVRWPGYAEAEDLPALIAGARALVYPSHYEGFGLPILEAMGCGTPVITSTAGSCPEVAGDAAILVEPRDVGAIARAMVALTRDGALADRLRAAGLERAAHFSWERCARETLAVLEGA